MRSDGLGRAVVSLVALSLVAATTFVVLVSALVAVGVPQWAASPTAVGATVAATLAVADVYTPFGNTERTDVLRERPVSDLGADVALAAGVGGAIGLAGAYGLLRGGGSGLARIVVLSAAVVVGYATFVARNLAVYREGPR